MIIGLGKFTMEIDIAEETRKMKKEMRKVGDKSGVGCTTSQLDQSSSKAGKQKKHGGHHRD